MFLFVFLHLIRKYTYKLISSIISTRDTLLQAKIGCGMMWIRDSLLQEQEIN